ncbi:alpha-2,8-sialyltransferase 8F-like isoform X2 [Brienomyrus brachyistius]|uniref:alpha-2,8-sialyltransferase 8F-like isoform X2 n=1 Tax=Brienomyrus brachyistius TaxID=42636 RepID=UPI0020B31501|nr:alpha-2,8-sialyltransferase 8F-like isoform X2 [Brienomyrus brachyistius]
MTDNILNLRFSLPARGSPGPPLGARPGGGAQWQAPGGQAYTHEAWLDTARTRTVTTERDLMKMYNPWWRKKEDRSAEFRSNLTNKCNAVSKAIITQANTPVGKKVVYDGEKAKMEEVTRKLFSIFVKVSPFGNVTWETCAVVGNGGILSNSSCGQEIDSAQFVFRCNLPPLGKDFKKHVGNKTNLVTANPSILLEKFEGLTERRRPFVESMASYGDALLLIPAFSYTRNMAVSLRAAYTLEEFQSPARTVFFSPSYLRSLAQFWKEQGLQVPRPSSGLIVASLALELCSEVRLYGFWPYPLHPDTHQTLTNHYYDNQQSMRTVHNMPAEFRHLLRLHSQGVLRVHLGECAARRAMSFYEV